jgi:hypothetical protein
LVISNPWQLTLLEELGGWEEDAFCLGLTAIPPNVHLEAKAHEVPVNKGHALWEAFPCVEREGTVVHLQTLEYFVGAEDLGAEHFGSVTA